MRVCRCGVIETDLAWACGERACPSCNRVWPENLIQIELKVWMVGRAVDLRELNNSWLRLEK